ncbi:hypothetical protein BDZ97DRAFT_1900644 [Flammula alnicola]|nr:hypothetical protein BDZ97DRAFT_1900644 [Flammula alnicola]
MASKRKSDAIESEAFVSESGEPFTRVLIPLDPPAKKARVSPTSDASSSTLKDKKPQDDSKPQSWRDVKLPSEGEVRRPFNYQNPDDCGDVRRKIRLLQQTPGWKVTHWLQEIGNINSNSYNRFMREKGKFDGAANGTYYCAYVYFEKVRVLEGKKKTAKRKSYEKELPNGFLL